jgi:hypothetical protein
MKTRTSLLALTLITAGTCALAEGPLGPSFSSTDAGSWAPQDTRVMGGPPVQSSAKLTRADVTAAIHEARRNGTLLPAGEAIGYPYPYKFAPATAAAMSPQESATVLGGPRRDGTTLDGYRFVGGEAGYVRQGIR